MKNQGTVHRISAWPCFYIPYFSVAYRHHDWSHSLISPLRKGGIKGMCQTTFYDLFLRSFTSLVVKVTLQSWPHIDYGWCLGQMSFFLFELLPETHRFCTVSEV
jgi:hypothetical protein